jgi:MFS family permease
MQSVAEPWLVLSLSGSSFLLGLDAFAMNAPFWLLALLGGVLADRRDRRLIIYFFSGIQMLCPLLIVILGAAGWIKVWIIIVLSLIVGITDALSSPAFSSLIPSIVSEEDLRPALALNSIQFNLSRVLGPAIAGLVMMRFGYLWCFGANTVSYIPFFLSIYWLRPPARDVAVREEADFSSGIADIKGIIRSPKTGWALLSVFFTAYFCGPIVTFSPVIVRDVLHGSAGQFGGVLTAFGIGGILGPLLILLTMKRVDAMKMSLSAALFYGLVMMGVSRAGTFWQLAALLVGSGFLMTVANTSANTFLQTQASNRNRGQTVSLYMLAMRGGMSLGNLVMGTVIGFSGPRVAFLMNGLLAIGIQAIIFRRMFAGRSRRGVPD